MASIAQEADKFAGINRPLITATAMMATTVIVLDINIAAIALPHMQGGLSANQDQVSWVVTTYFMMQASTMAATGWLADRIGRKRLFVGALTGFAFCSLMAGNAETIPEIMFYRGLQGLCSAPVVPISQALMLDSYPRERHGQALAIWGTGVMFAPVMGPVIGGWLTDELSWRWVFYVSTPFAILGVLGALLSVKETKIDRNRPFDYFGYLCLVLALASLQLTLDRGEIEGWFDSNYIIVTASACLLGLYLFTVHSMTTQNPFISPGIFRDKNLMLGIFFQFMLGFLVLSMNVIMPLFLQNLREFPILLAAMVMMPRGFGTLIGLVVAGRLSNKVDPRAIIIFGFLCVAFSSWRLSNFTIDVGLWDFVIAAFFNGIGIGAIWVPLTAVSFWTLPSNLRTEASTFTSLFRNYGSGIGVSVVISILSRSQSTAHAHMTERVNPYTEAMQEPWLPEQWNLSSVEGLRLLDTEIGRQAMSIGFFNDFHLIMIGALASIPIVMLLSRGATK
ncbi:MAG: EmrB/QacA family drug resistance transporter [Rhodospirillaceae bacterium]|nr:EmrB/QacA family drug resistance transporter [Rhodospirillaceae bacterium]|tara:strand:+ start:64486 stop:66003 length:1518 start_codon:yes stop_codon:yes gene_type:complete